jgi:HEAT repeat protein
VERLFDKDLQIRDLAVDALSGYPRSELDGALDFARRALHSEDTDRVRAAAEGLARLVDVQAITDLIDAHSRGGEAAEVSRRSLQTLTNQDFGSSTRKWRSWWSKNKDRSRIEWMLDGLSHKNIEVRKAAADALREITGEYFGYQHDVPKKEREQARQRWLEWWNDSGKERFERKRKSA